MIIFTPNTVIKSTEINANFSGLADGSEILAGAITNAKLNTTAGELGGVWLTYNPISSGITIGNGTSTGRYTSIGKTVIFTINVTFGSTTTTSGLFTFAVPKTSANQSQQTAFAAWGIDTGVSFYTGVGRLAANASTFTVNRTNDTWQATAPFTWGNTDAITISGSYESA